MNWKPHVTVAAIIERDSRFLMVEEICGGDAVINQPAGHLEDNETLLDAVIRETLEETAWDFTPTNITGIYQWQTPHTHKTYLRVCFSGYCNQHHGNLPLDEGIIRALWLTRTEIERLNCRSSMVLRCIDDYLSGQQYPLNLIQSIPT